MTEEVMKHAKDVLDKLEGGMPANPSKEERAYWEPRYHLIAATIKQAEARKDAAYLERNQVVAALARCFPSGIARTAIAGWDEEWHGCVYIDLPTGQVSWHYHDSQVHLFADLPAYTEPWDGHDTDEKYHRLSMLKHNTAQERER